MPASATAFTDRLKLIEAADSLEPLQHAVRDAMAFLDIRPAYFVAPLNQDLRLGRVLSNLGCSRLWERLYRARLYACDPWPAIALDRMRAFSWPFDVDLEALAGDERRFYAISRRYGLATGVGCACFGANGRTGFLGGGWTGPKPPGEVVLLRINAIAQIGFQRYCHLFPINHDVPPLSDREFQVLHWISLGKSNSVIAEILGISASSVDSYVKRVFAKLRVTDRTSAAVKALSLGMLLSHEQQDLLRQADRREKGSGDTDTAD